MAQKAAPLVILHIPRDRAESYSHALSDILCWASGFIAGTPDSSNHPLGMDELRNLNVKLKNELSRRDTIPLPEYSDGPDAVGLGRDIQDIPNGHAPDPVRFAAPTLRKALEDIAAEFAPTISLPGVPQWQVKDLAGLKHKIDQLLGQLAKEELVKEKQRGEKNSLPPHPMIEWDAYQCWGALFKMRASHTGLDHLRWIFHRLHTYHKEDRFIDYMHTFLSIIRQLEEVEKRLGLPQNHPIL